MPGWKTSSSMRAKANCTENAPDSTIRALGIVPNRSCILICSAHFPVIFTLPRAHLKAFQNAFRQRSEIPPENRKI